MARLLGSILFMAIAGCAATLDSEAKDTFAKAFACPTERITVTETARPAGDPRFTVVEVTGCGRRQLYACSSDWTLGCLRPGEHPPQPPWHEATESPGTTFPPTLVDQAPPPPPPPPDTQDGT